MANLRKIQHGRKEEFMQINDPNPIVIEEGSGQNYADYNTGFLSLSTFDRYCYRCGPLSGC